jgi:hypothetical protein
MLLMYLNNPNSAYDLARPAEERVGHLVHTAQRLRVVKCPLRGRKQGLLGRSLGLHNVS